jgi:mRNA-degrading endonuclease HigB of HigAB toxin-antitoxin module
MESLAGYILGGFIVITTFCIMVGLTHKLGRTTGAISLIGTGVVCYVILSIVDFYSDYSLLILIACFIVEIVILGLLVIFYHRDIIVTASIVYAILIVIALITARSCYNNDMENKEKSEAREQSITTYKNQYDFNVDELINQFQYADWSKHKVKLKFPIIAYRKSDGRIIFDVEFNKFLNSKHLTDFSFKNINIIVILEHLTIDLGTYSNGKTRAQKIQTMITFIDKKTMQKISDKIIVGGNPPERISYKGSTPISRSGGRPTNDKIIEIIQTEFK